MITSGLVRRVCLPLGNAKAVLHKAKSVLSTTYGALAVGVRGGCALTIDRRAEAFPMAIPIRLSAIIRTYDTAATMRGTSGLVVANDGTSSAVLVRERPAFAISEGA